MHSAVIIMFVHASIVLYKYDLVHHQSISTLSSTPKYCQAKL